MLPNLRHLEKIKTMETIKRTVVMRGWRKGEINRAKKIFRILKIFCVRLY
jgi:hypothetical protein